MELNSELYHKCSIVIPKYDEAQPRNPYTQVSIMQQVSKQRTPIQCLQFSHQLPPKLLFLFFHLLIAFSIFTREEDSSDPESPYILLLSKYFIDGGGGTTFQFS